MARHLWNPPALHSNYGQLRQTIEHRSNQPGSITLDQATTVHKRWRQLGKLAQAGRL